MAVAEMLAPQPDELVLDLTAAPGGKATHLVALMGNSGVFVANEIERSRTRSLAQNLERWGARRTIITNETPQRLAEQWGALFDRVLVDAPVLVRACFANRRLPLTSGVWMRCRGALSTRNTCSQPLLDWCSWWPCSV